MEPIRIELPAEWGMGSVNAYLFTHPEVILVDTGVRTDECWSALIARLAAHNVGIPDISRVIITHPHIDHFGLASRITSESDATVWISDLGAPWLLASSGLWVARSNFYRHYLLPRLDLPPDIHELILQEVDDLQALAAPVAEERLVTFQVGDDLRMGGMDWRVIHAPGHASAQTVFHQPETRQLLSADLLLAIMPAPVIEQPSGEKLRREPSLPLLLQSLDVVDNLAVDTVYPGHWRPFGNHRKVIAAQRERIQIRKAECLALVREGRSTISELLQAMYGNQPPKGRLAGVWMLLGYLDLLAAEGAVHEEEIERSWRYFAI